MENNTDTARAFILSHANEPLPEILVQYAECIINEVPIGQKEYVNRANSALTAHVNLAGEVLLYNNGAYLSTCTLAGFQREIANWREVE